MRINEIEARLAAIEKQLRDQSAVLSAEELDKLEKEVDALEEERSQLRDVEKRRTDMLGRIAKGTAPGAHIVRTFGDPSKDDEEDEPENVYASPEYRTAWLKRLRGLKLTAKEERAYSNVTGSGAEVIPTVIAQKIIEKIEEQVPLLGDITLMHVKGSVKFAIEGTDNDAGIHAENSTMTAAEDGLIEVALSGYEIVKLVQISDTVKTMSMKGFESWIIKMLAKSISRKINAYIVSGTGSSQPTGIEKANTWGNSNSITVGKTASLTKENVLALIGMLDEGYDSDAKFVMSKKTLFNDFMPLQDNAKAPIITREGKNYFVYGYPVRINKNVPLHEAYLGDLEQLVGNLAEDVTVHTDYEIKSNSYLYSGVAIFDCKPATGAAFVKLVKAAA